MFSILSSESYIDKFIGHQLARNKKSTIVGTKFHLPMVVLTHSVPNSLDLSDFVNNQQRAILSWMVEKFGLGMSDINDHWEQCSMVMIVVGHLNTPNGRHLNREKNR